MVFGHEKIKKELLASSDKGLLSHAYIFSGPEGVGKFRLALELAEKMNGTRSGSDTDIMIICPASEEVKGVTKTKKIGIEDIRDMQSSLGLSASAGRYKIGIIDGAERLTKASQNALLKTLEEPSGKSVVFLITSDIGKLLPTIVSRCQTKRFSILSDEDMRSVIGTDQENREEIISLSFGRPGWALEMIRDENYFLEMRNNLKELSIAIGDDLNLKFDLADKMGKDKEKTIKELSIWAALLRKNILGEYFLGISQPRALKSIGRIEKAVSGIANTNVNARLVIENLFLDFDF